MSLSRPIQCYTLSHADPIPWPDGTFKRFLLKIQKQPTIRSFLFEAEHKTKTLTYFWARFFFPLFLLYQKKPVK